VLFLAVLLHLESNKKGETAMKQGLFEVFGDGKLGLKADDLNRLSEKIIGSGMTIIDGFVIATGIFDQFIGRMNFSEKTPPEDIIKCDCPDFLLHINEAILDRLEIDRPYAIRSSALSERGGTGIYKSTFFWPTGNRTEDLHRLWQCEAKVYASEFTLDAKLWRKRNLAPSGMAILIHRVIGFRCKDFFLPACNVSYVLHGFQLFVQLTHTADTW
jgi:hypothetical protein